MEEAEESDQKARKALKKQRKSQAVARKETGITCCSKPTKNILICNAGLSTGLTEEALLDNFLKHGPLLNVVMLPGKSCCFVTYEDIRDAVSAYNSFNGKLKIGQDNKPVYLGYTEEVTEDTFADYNLKPPGLFVIPDFVTTEEEELLLGLNDFKTGKCGAMKHRQVVHYGYEFRYDINNVDKNDPLDEKIPDACDFLWARLAARGEQLQIGCGGICDDSMIGCDSLKSDNKLSANKEEIDFTSNNKFIANNEEIEFTCNQSELLDVNYITNESTSRIPIKDNKSDRLSSSEHDWSNKSSPMNRLTKSGTTTVNTDQLPTVFKPDQLTINHYKPGHGIPPHVDTHSAFEDPIISLSLGSDIVMDFKHSDGRHLPVYLPVRSLAIISGESRYDWTHGITPRKYDIISTNLGRTVQKRGTRTSFTFRTVRRGDCCCVYHNNCDSYKKVDLPENVAAELERNHVHEVYESIATHFSDTRHKPWPNVLDFVSGFGVGSVLVDIGCGNGKYLGRNKNIFEMGCDTSFGLIDVCNERGFQVLNANCLQVPIKDNVADGVISIAVIHHLSTKLRRKQALTEIIRILRPNGQALIYVWAKDQCRNDKSSYLKQDRKNRKHESNVISVDTAKNVSVNGNLKLPVHTNRKQFQHQDVLVPWKLKKDNTMGDEYLRYYHVFEEGELEVLCRSFEEIEVVKSYYDQGNWCVIFRKGDTIKTKL